MQTWHPRGLFAVSNRPGGSFVGVPWKIVLHTTESVNPYLYDPSSYYGNPYWPHATIDTEGIHQHIPISASAYALYRGGVQTNNANVVQCEIVWRAGDIENIPDATLVNVADWIRWVSEQTGAPLVVCAQGFHGPGEGMVLASEDSPIRFNDEDWLAFSGICGHQHVPSGNDHWDPGRFPIDRCLGIAQEDDMFTEDDRTLLLLVKDKVLPLLGDCATGLAEWKSGSLPSPRLDAIDARLAALEHAQGGKPPSKVKVSGTLDVTSA